MAALELVDVRAGYGRIEVLHGLSLTVPSGCTVALLGPNGVGKTTTMRAIAGLLPVRHGSVLLAGRPIENRRPSTVARAGVMLVPEGRGIFPGLSVRDNLLVAHNVLHRDGGESWDAFFDRIAETFPRLAERMNQVAGSLSGGEQQMLALSRALAGDPKVLLFDDLSMGLAPLIVDQLFEHVAALRAQGRTILLVEQFLTHALRVADICYVLARGRVAWAGEPGEIRESTEAALYLSA